jgi:hypothetical protein
MTVAIATDDELTQLAPVQVGTLTRLILAAAEPVEHDLDDADDDTYAQAWRDAIVTLYVANSGIAEWVADQLRELTPDLMDWMRAEKLRAEAEAATKTHAADPPPIFRGGATSDPRFKSASFRPESPRSFGNRRERSETGGN